MKRRRGTGFAIATALRRRILFAVVALCILLAGQGVLAEEVSDEIRETAEVTATESIYNAIGIIFERPDIKAYKVELYRSDKKNSGYKLVNTWDLYSWHEVTDEAEIYTGDNGGEKCYIAEKEIFVCDENLKFNRKYWYRAAVYGYRFTTGGRKKVTCTTEPTAVRTRLSGAQIIRALTGSDNKVKFTWMQVAGAQGYEVYRYADGSWKRMKVVSKGTATTYTDGTAKGGKTYQYKVKAWRKSGGKKITGDYGNTCKISTKAPKVKGNYSPGSVYGPSLPAGKLKEVRNAVQIFCDNYIKKGMTDYEKVLTAYNYLRMTCSYAWRGWQYNGANTAWGALVYGEAQCSGYARAMKALCDAMGVGCYYIHANGKSANPSHQWNQVRVDGKWYIVDPQGGAFLWSAKSYKSLGMRWDENKYPKCSSDYKR